MALGLLFSAFSLVSTALTITSTLATPSTASGIVAGVLFVVLVPLSAVSLSTLPTTSAGYPRDCRSVSVRGSVFSPTDPATSVPSTRASVYRFICVKVSIRAIIRLFSMDRDVVFSRDRKKVVRVPTRPYSAGVVYLKTVRYATDQQGVRESVNLLTSSDTVPSFVFHTPVYPATAIRIRSLSAKMASLVHAPHYNSSGLIVCL